MFKIIPILLVVFLSCSHAEKKNETSKKWTGGKAPLEFSSKSHLSATGQGQTQEEAQNRAKKALAEIFVSEIKSQTSTNKGYTFSDGEESSSTSYASNISISTDVKLKNVEIKKTYFDKELESYFALAVLDKKVAKRMFDDELHELRKKIDALVDSFNKKPTVGKATKIKKMISTYEGTNNKLAVVNNGKRRNSPLSYHTWEKISSKANEISMKNYVFIEYTGDYSDFKNLVTSCLSDKNIKVVTNPEKKKGSAFSVNIKLTDEEYPMQVKGWVHYAFRASATIKNTKNKVKENATVELDAKQRRKSACYQRVKNNLSDELCEKVFQFVSR